MRILVGLVLVGSFLGTSSVGAAQTVDPWWELLFGASQCTSPNNPLKDGLKRLGGNLFIDPAVTANSDGSILVTADVVFQMGHLDILKGSVQLTLSYAQTSFPPPLVCSLKVQPTP